MINKYFLLLMIVIVGGFLRFYSIASNPPSLTWDEAAWGYNAYSLLHTGRDEFGKVLPITYLESFGDFKPPAYAYLSIVPVMIFGLNEFSTRFASAFFGSMTVLVTYFLTVRIFFRSEKKAWYGLVGALFLAISPWHVNLSRAAFEANVATFFLVFGVYSFFDGIQKRSFMLSVSAVSLVLSMYTFNTSRIVAPLLIISLTVCFWKSLWNRKKAAVTAIILGLILVAPLIPFLMSPQARLRFQEVNIFTDSAPVTISNQQIAINGNGWWAKLLENRRVFFARDFVKHYLDNLSPSFLFISGDGNPKFSTQQVGQMYLFDIPFFIIGGFLLFRRKEGYWYILPLWLLLGIIPAATARETPHALRIETILPVPQILTAYGFVLFFIWLPTVGWLHSKMRRVGVYASLFLLLGVNVLYYVHDYYANYATTYSGEWQYGYKDALSFAKQQESTSHAIFFTSELGRPYAYYLFYSQLPPRQFQMNASVTRDVFGFVSVDRVGKYYFGNKPPQIFPRDGSDLYIMTPDAVPPGATVMKTFRLENGEPVLVAFRMGI